MQKVELLPELNTKAQSISSKLKGNTKFEWITKDYIGERMYGHIVFEYTLMCTDIHIRI